MHCRSKAQALFSAAAVFMLVLALAGCGAEAPAAGSSTVEVASLPAGQVWVDGVDRGTTPVTLTLSAGSHEVTVKQDGFADHTSTVQLKAGATEKVDVALVLSDAENAGALARLAGAYEIEIEPFEAPALHRGSNPSEPVVLLWPNKDVRMVGLTSYAIEVGTDYDGTMLLEFRDGRDVLHSERFDPAGLTHVAAIPPAVLENVKPGSKITWGLFKEGTNKGAFKTTFEVVNHPKADRKLEKMASDRAVARQSPIVRELLVAKTLENYRLYTEALIKGLEIITANPDSTQPYQGIVSTLRRMDGDKSRLWATASQFVSGAGRNRTGATNTGLQGFSNPSLRVGNSPMPDPIASSGGKVQGPAGAVTPRDAGNGDGSPVTTPDSGKPTTSTDDTTGTGGASTGGVGRTGPSPLAAEAQRAADKAEAAARTAAQANAAVSAAQAALDAATAAVDANPGDPEAMARADEARHAMDAALQAAQNAADAAQTAADAAATAAARAAEAANAPPLPGSGPSSGPIRPGESGATEFAQRAADKATAAARISDQASAAQQAAQAALEAATDAMNANPGDPIAMAQADEARHALDAANVAAQDAADAAELAARVAEAAAAAAANVPALPGTSGTGAPPVNPGLQQAAAKVEAAQAAQSTANAALANAQAAFEAAASSGEPGAMEFAQQALDAAHANAAAAESALRATLEVFQAMQTAAGGN